MSLSWHLVRPQYHPEATAVFFWGGWNIKKSSCLYGFLSCILIFLCIFILFKIIVRFFSFFFKVGIGYTYTIIGLCCIWEKWSLNKFYIVGWVYSWVPCSGILCIRGVLCRWPTNIRLLPCMIIFSNLHPYFVSLLS